MNTRKNSYSFYGWLVIIAGVYSLFTMNDKIFVGILFIASGVMILFISNLRGKPLTRYQLVENRVFFLEKVSGELNEGLYLISDPREKNEKLFYEDFPGFENGFYVRDGEKIFKKADYTPRLPV